MKLKKEFNYLIPLAVFIIIFSFTLACGGQSEAASTTTKEPQVEEKESVQQEAIEEVEETIVEEPEEKAEEDKKPAVEEEANAEVSQVVVHLWEDVIGTIWFHGAVEITNTGNTPIRIGDVHISIYDSNDNVVGTSTFMLPIPEVLKPGEKSYSCESNILEKIDSADIEVYAKANIDYDKTEEESQSLDVQKIEGAEGDWHSYLVVGEVINISDEKAEDIRIIIALFDESGSLIGALNPMVDVTLNPGDSMAFEGSYPELPNEIGKKAKSFIGKSFNWTWDF